LQNILRLREKRVEDVMVQRAEVHAVDEDIPIGELLQRFEETGHSRLPVYDDNLDDPRGMVLVKDLMLHLISVSGGRSKADDTEPAKLDFTKVNLDTPLAALKITRKVLFVPPSMLAADLMARMQATRTQMALVIDEYGGTDGLVSLEDIVEEVVGEIEDEHDDDEDDGLFEQTGEGIWTVDARTELERIAEEIGPQFDPGEHGEDMDTLGGLVFTLAGHIPVRGEVVRGMPGFEFRVLDADPRRVRRLQIVQTASRPPRRKSEKGNQAGTKEVS
jgi:CBS domain containing-hemolysin-like protein